jgi:hypothetical protein
MADPSLSCLKFQTRDTSTLADRDREESVCMTWRYHYLRTRGAADHCWLPSVPGVATVASLGQ